MCGTADVSRCVDVIISVGVGVGVGVGVCICVSVGIGIGISVRIDILSTPIHALLKEEDVCLSLASIEDQVDVFEGEAAVTGCGDFIGSEWKSR